MVRQTDERDVRYDRGARVNEAQLTASGAACLRDRRTERIERRTVDGANDHGRRSDVLPGLRANNRTKFSIVV
jgi:hypothetical protein